MSMSGATPPPEERISSPGFGVTSSSSSGTKRTISVESMEIEEGRQPSKKSKSTRHGHGHGGGGGGCIYAQAAREKEEAGPSSNTTTTTTSSSTTSSSTKHHHSHQHHHSHHHKSKGKDKKKGKGKGKGKEKGKEKEKEKRRKEKNKLKKKAAMSASKTMTIQQGFQGVVTATSDSIIRSVNPYAARMFGWRSEELVGQRLEVLMPPQFAQQHHSFITRHEESRENRAIGITRRVEGLHVEGNTFPLLLHVTEVTTVDGAPLYVALLEHDDTPTGHAVIDSSGILHYVNGSMTDIFGFSRLELEGFNVSKLMPEPYASAHDSFISNYEATGVKKVLDKVRHVPALHKNGALFPISLRVKQLETDEGRRYEALVDRVEDMEAMMTFDQNGLIKSVTTSFRLMYGYESSELLGQHVSKLLGDMSEYDMSVASFEKLAQSLQEFEYEMARLKLGSRRVETFHKDGSTFTVCVTIQDYFPLELVQSSDLSSDASGMSAPGDSTGFAGGSSGSGGSNTNNNNSSFASVDHSTRMFSAFFTPWVDPAELDDFASVSDEDAANDMWKEAGEDDTIEVSHPALAKYKFRNLIGKGSSGEVRRAVDMRNGEDRAIKIVRTDKLEADSIDLVRLHNEISLLKVCDHPNIVKLYDVVETDTRMYLVMEMVSGKDLVHLWHYDNPVEPGLSEDEARGLFIPVVQAIHYLHSHNIIHRDIKLDNIMLTVDGSIKLVDFGFATSIEPGTMLTKWCGTPYYSAPEIFRNIPYAFKADIWSLGVVLYLYLSGQMPFESPSAIVSGSYYLSPKYSSLARDLLSSMLVVSPDSRLSISDVALHPWLRA